MKSATWKFCLWTVLLLGGGYAALRLVGVDLGFRGDAAAGLEGAPVRRGGLRISVVERANLKAAKSVNLKCELEGRTTILWLIPEGTLVEPGELVCQLDTSAQVEKRVVQEIAVQNAEAAWVKAKQQLAIQQSQNESDVKTAEQALDFAERDLVKYEEGEHPQSLQAADEEITLAEEDATRRYNELEWSRKLAEKGFLTRTQLDADQFAYNSANIKREQARRTKLLLVDYDHPRRMLELQAAIEEARRELERVQLQAAARITDYEADVRTSEAKYKLERDELEKLLTQIEKAALRAPVAGMIVYAKEDRGRWGGGDPIQEGTEVRERQDIITIPSSHGMVAEMSLHESVLEKVHEGMRCVVDVDAVRGMQFTGRVKFKSTLPDQNSWWANPDLRVYRTEIEVLEADPRLKTGMSCSVEVIVQDLKDALHVPVQSIFLSRGQPCCFVVEGGRIAVRDVEVGPDNGKWVQVLSGLQEGEIVLLSQPPGWTLEPAIQEDVPVDELLEEGDVPESRREGGEGRPAGGAREQRTRGRAEGETGAGARSAPGQEAAGAPETTSERG